MPELTIIADDLTGAADCGSAFTAAGLPTFVVLGEGPVPSSALIVARDIDTRGLARPEAVARVLLAARDAYGQGSRTLYKKIDSTLRGHVGAEVAAAYRAAVEACPKRPLVIATPAFPAAGRTVRDGRVFVHGIALEKTELWRRSGMSGPSGMLDMLAQAGMEAALLPVDAVRSGPTAVARAVSEMAAGGAEALVCDAEEDLDLKRIAQAGAEQDLPVLWAGSAGLARELPEALRLRGQVPSLRRVGASKAGPVALLVASRSSVSREQARNAAAEDGVETWTVSPEVLLEGSRAAAWVGLASEIGRALVEGKDILLLAGLDPELELSRGSEIAGSLARLVATEVRRLGGLVATGGDMARATLAALGARGLHLVGEVEPGVPLCLTDTAERVPVVTKAGGLGTPFTLRRARAALKGRAST
ncbi:MAG TPA: four-carbon acid sugar kinase family protein [Anaeromyxobacteraceae bacterium]|nr:four-carbon acid sugar kinase family protein [Anaeromyxobacteraceae bacterium]